MQLEFDLEDCHIQVKDILTFAPFLSSQPAFANPASTWFIDGNITGSVSNMNIQNLQLKAFNNTNLNIRGTIAGLPDANKLRGNLVIGQLRTSRKDLEMLAPKGSMPNNITLPEIINLRGTIAGSMADVRANLELISSLGSASVNGTISNATDKNNARYNGTLATRELDLGVIMQNDSLYGPLTASITASGKGFDPKTANANIKGVINSVVLNRYNYKNVSLGGQLLNQKAAFNLNINDPNITIDLDGRGDLSGKFPAVTLNAVIDSIKTLPLHFTTDTLVYHGNIKADFPNTDPANLEGELFVTQSVIRTGYQKYALDTIALTSGKNDSGKFVRIRSDAVSAELSWKIQSRTTRLCISAGNSALLCVGPNS